MSEQQEEYPPNPPSLIKLSVNRTGTDWFVGDLHGETELLHRLLNHLRFDKRADRLICSGDLVDRGPDSAGMLKLFEESPKWFFATLGNHDAMMREACIHDRIDVVRAWDRNGGKWVWGKPSAERRRLARPLLRMPLALEVPLRNGTVVGVIHAELPDHVLWSDIPNMEVGSDEAIDASGRDANYILWARKRVRCALVVANVKQRKEMTLRLRLNVMKHLTPAPGVDLLVVGHTQLQPKRPLRILNYLWLDTGAGYTGGRLTLADPVSGIFVQAGHGKRILHGKLTPPISLEPWKVGEHESEEAEALRKEEKEKSLEALRAFGY